MKKSENGKIIIVELISTGFNYVEDCIRRGYEPVVLEQYLDEEFFTEYEKKDYSPARYGIMKNLISAENMDILASPIIQFLPEMRSFFCSMIQTSAKSSHIPQTIDLDTSLGAVLGP